MSASIYTEKLVEPDDKMLAYDLAATKDVAKVFGGLQKLVGAFYKIQKILYAS